MNRIAVVTGGSSGIGLCTARALRDAGCTVYELSRRESSENGIIHIRADVTDEESVKNAVNEIQDTAGRIDILVNNAGFGISGAAEFTDPSDARAQMDVNLFGMDTVTRAVIPVMRKNGGGRIICISSIAAIVPIPFQLWYSVSKAAINAYVSAISGEVRPFGITVCAVMPGDIKTGFTGARRKAAVGDDIYCGRIERSVAVMEHDEQNGMKPETAAAVIRRVALKRRVKPFYSIGIQYKAVAFLVRILPCGLVNRLVGMIYAK